MSDSLCPRDCSMPGFPALHHLPEFAQTQAHWVCGVIHHLILCHSVLLLPSIFPSIRVFSNELALCIRWPKYWSFSNSFSNEYSGLISFRIDWFYLLPRDSQKSSLAPQFKSISFSALSHLHGPTLMSVHDFGAQSHKFVDLILLCSRWAVLVAYLFEGSWSVIAVFDATKAWSCFINIYIYQFSSVQFN